jgi:hypothetical protein
MSYDLHFDCGPLDQAHSLTGGTYAMGGTTEPWLNITYNYATHFQKFLGEGGIRSLYGKNAAEVVAHTEKAISAMDGEPDEDYWAATEGNAKAALMNLRDLAKLCPQDAVLDGD